MNPKSKDKRKKPAKDNPVGAAPPKPKINYNEKIVVDASFEELIKELVTPNKK